MSEMTVNEAGSRGGLRSAYGYGSNVSPARLQTYLKGIDYPAEKAQIIRHARGNGAPYSVIELLDRLEEGHEYTMPTSVVRGIWRNSKPKSSFKIHLDSAKQLEKWQAKAAELCVTTSDMIKEAVNEYIAWHDKTRTKA